MRGAICACFVPFVLGALPVHAGEGNVPVQVKPNTWVKAAIDWKAALPKDIKDAGWSTTDGYSDNLYRSKTGTVLIRTGVRSKAQGLSPGFYTNASVEWNLATDTARVIDIANWGGGSYGYGRLLPAFKDRPTPTPRHTYDGICYVPEEDAMYMVLGANWRVGGRGADEEAKKQLKIDNGLTWRYDFEQRRWTSIDHNVWSLFKCSPYEAHLQHWPEGKRLLFFNDGGNKYAEFDLASRKWETVTLRDKCPMSLYNARSTWDSKRSLWVFRLGPRLCTFDPRTRTFAALPNCWDTPIPTRKELKEGKAKRDPRLAMKGICYISKHDAYLVTGPTGDDTMIYRVEEKRWVGIKGGPKGLVNGYCQYNPRLDIVAMNFQLQCFTFRYVPGKGPAGK